MPWYLVTAGSVAIGLVSVLTVLIGEWRRHSRQVVVVGGDPPRGLGRLRLGRRIPVTTVL
jgi:hypothetical protein